MKKKLIIIIFISILISTIFFLPRFLINFIGIENLWTSYLYHYLLGGICFFIGIFLIIKSKACNISIKKDKLWLILLILGYFFMLLLHALWITFAIHYPYLGN